jgi:DNA primase catalytic subunit
MKTKFRKGDKVKCLWDNSDATIVEVFDRDFDSGQEEVEYLIRFSGDKGLVRQVRCKDILLLSSEPEEKEMIEYSNVELLKIVPVP